ncbi:MAG TPA: hypothetical protein DCX21_00170 [Eubacterium sp.]|nr:hypothetical protein [Eubacterium sp.]
MDKELLYRELDQYIRDNYIPIKKAKPFGAAMANLMGARAAKASAEPMISFEPMRDEECMVCESSIDDYLEKELKKETVGDRLNAIMARDNLTTAIIYQRCFIDRKLISKITKGDGYHPSKDTMLALCIGLHLGLEDADSFMELAGFSFNPSRLYDLIIKYFISKEVYDIDVINEMLDKYGQECIGVEP